MNDRVQAIGVLGSDVFDKLMVLQIFRRHFPDTVYFTTDLDAVYLHNDTPEATRNLVIASPYGLDPMLDGPMGPEVDFRDSYQTSLFRTVVEMLGGAPPPTKKEAWGRPIPPIRIWEVGRSAFYELAQGTPVEWTAGEFDGEKPAERAAELPWWERGYTSGFLMPLLGMLCVLLQGVVAGLAVRWWRNREGGVLERCWRKLPDWFRHCFEGGGVRAWLTGRALIVVLILGVAFVVPRFLGDLLEPFAWFDGVSIWPSVTIRLIVAVVGFVYFTNALAEVERSREELAQAIGSDQEIDRGLLRYPLTGSIGRTLRSACLLSLGWFAVFPLVMLAMEPVSTVFFTPARGFAAFVANEVSVVLSVATLVLLTWLAVVQQVRLRDWLRRLRKWLEAAKGVVRPEVVDRIADHTNEVSQTVVYPFVVMLLLLASRHSVFDAWNIPPALWVTCGIILLLLLGSGISLNRSANRLKRSQQDLVGEVEREVKGDATGVAWQHWQVASGPFGTWRNQPVVRAVIVAAAALGLSFMEPVLKLLGG